MKRRVQTTQYDRTLDRRSMVLLTGIEIQCFFCGGRGVDLGKHFRLCYGQYG